MLPTKGYFQDIECPFYNTTCGRPYCHFRHKRKPNEIVEDNLQDTSKTAVPIYRPTPKSELANIHNSKSHIPISYVPDLSFVRDRPARPVKIDKPTYKPTPLSILTSATTTGDVEANNTEHEETIKDIQENIASTVYDPSKSEINFEGLSKDFSLIESESNESEDAQDPIKDLIQLKHDIEQEQNRLTILQSEIEQDVPLDGHNLNKEKENVTEDKHLNKFVDNQDAEKSKSNEKNESSEKTTKEHKSSHKSKTKEKDKRSKDPSKEKSSRDKSSNKDKHSKRSDRSSSHKSSSREKHQRDDKKDTVKTTDCKEKKCDNKDESILTSEAVSNDSEPQKDEKRASTSTTKKHKHRDRSRSKSKKINKESRHRSKSRSRSKEKHKSKSKRESSGRSRTRHDDKHSSKRKHSTSPTKENKKAKREKHQSESSDTSRNDPNGNDLDIEEESNVLEADFDQDDEDETLRECYKIFSEYKPEPIEPQQTEEVSVKKDLFEEQEDIVNTYLGKKRTAHAGAEGISACPKNHTLVPPKSILLPGQVLAHRYKLAKQAQANNEQEGIMNEVKSITLPVRKPPTSLLEAARLHKMKRNNQVKARTNLMDDILNGIHKSSPSQFKPAPKKIAAVPNVALIEKAKQRISIVKQQTIQTAKTVAHTQKGTRIAHIPEYSLSEIPDVLQANKSKLPVNVRTRFLTMIAEECIKLYASRDDAYSRALNEEFSCYQKCKVLATYKNSAILAVNRMRKEIQDRESKGLGLVLMGESVMEKKETDFEGRTFYNNIKKWILNEEELNIHGYPRESGEKGKAIINNRLDKDYSSIDENQRRCSRCGKNYQVDDDGWPLYEEECMYHPLKKRTLRGEQIYLCCKSNDETGCVTSDTHVFDGLPKHCLDGYQTTLPPESEDDVRSSQVYALDCEMCYTTKGLELTRVTIIDTECKTIYESLVKPLNPIIDYNTRFSGITKEQMERTSTSILQVQANILHLCNSQTILIGHSLESDMKALKIVHSSIIDTSVMFPHKMGLPHKRALRVLASEYLKKIIQNDVGGHDSAEDAVTCMELIKWKLREELKIRTK